MPALATIVLVDFSTLSSSVTWSEHILFFQGISQQEPWIHHRAWWCRARKLSWRRWRDRLRRFRDWCLCWRPWWQWLFRRGLFASWMILRAWCWGTVQMLSRGVGGGWWGCHCVCISVYLGRTWICVRYLGMRFMRKEENLGRIDNSPRYKSSV